MDTRLPSQLQVGLQGFRKVVRAGANGHVRAASNGGWVSLSHPRWVSLSHPLSHPRWMSLSFARWVSLSFASLSFARWVSLSLYRAVGVPISLSRGGCPYLSMRWLAPGPTARRSTGIWPGSSTASESLVSVLIAAATNSGQSAGSAMSSKWSTRRYTLRAIRDASGHATCATRIAPMSITD